MNYEKEIEELKRQMKRLQESYLQMSKNQVPVVEKADDAINKADAVTPYRETKVAYYGETEKIFYDVPNGIVSVFFDNYNGEYTADRLSDRLIVTFPEKLTDSTNVTIMIQK